MSTYNELFKVLTSIVEHVGILSEITQLYVMKASQSADFPYSVVTVPTLTTDEYFDGTIYAVVFQVSTWGEDAQAALQGADAINEKLHDSVIPISGMTSLRCLNIYSGTMVEQDGVVQVINQYRLSYG